MLFKKKYIDSTIFSNATAWMPSVAGLAIEQQICLCENNKKIYFMLNLKELFSISTGKIFIRFKKL